jgi:hypothetical protein
MRKFKYENQEYEISDEKILRKCNRNAIKIKRCKKGRYGFEVVYELDPQSYDNRDSGLVNVFISFFQLI